MKPKDSEKSHSGKLETAVEESVTESIDAFEKPEKEEIDTGLINFYDLYLEYLNSNKHAYKLVSEGIKKLKINEAGDPHIRYGENEGLCIFYEHGGVFLTPVDEEVVTHHFGFPGQGISYPEELDNKLDLSTALVGFIVQGDYARVCVYSPRKPQEGREQKGDTFYLGEAQIVRSDDEEYRVFIRNLAERITSLCIPSNGKIFNAEGIPNGLELPKIVRDFSYT